MLTWQRFQFCVPQFSIFHAPLFTLLFYTLPFGSPLNVADLSPLNIPAM